jgi:hypothetical protein
VSEPAFEQASLFELEPLSPAIAAMAAVATPELPAPDVRDPAQMGFSVVGNGAATLLRSTFDRKRLATAIAVYGALASDMRSPGEFRARRKDVAAYAGVSDRTVDSYAREFERIGLLEVVRPRGGRRHPSNLWRLLQVAGDLRGEANRTPSDSGGEANRTSNGLRGEANRTPGLKKKDLQEGNVIPFRERRSPAGGKRDFSHFDRAMNR